MKKIVKIVLLAGFLCQAPVYAGLENPPTNLSVNDDSFGVKLVCAVAVATFAVVGFNYLKNYFFGSSSSGPKANKKHYTPGEWGETGKDLTKTEKIVPKTVVKKLVTPGGKTSLEPVGFHNSGVDCYLNALLTTLLYTESFASFLLEHAREIKDLFVGCGDKQVEPYVKKITRFAEENTVVSQQEKDAWKKYLDNNLKNKDILKKILLVELVDLALQIHVEKIKKPLIQERVKQCVCVLGPLDPTLMNDSSEAANPIFDALELIKNSGEKIPALRKLLGFDVVCQEYCSVCTLRESQTYHANITRLPLPRSVSQTSAVAFKTILESAKNIVGDHVYFCGGKNCFTETKVFNGISGVLPKLLMFAFDRNYFDEKKQTFIKNSLPIKIPLCIDVGPYTNNKGPQKYTLCGIVNHSGSGTGGHYTSFVKSGKQWHEFDDKNVKPIVDPIKPSSQLSSMLLYQKV